MPEAMRPENLFLPLLRWTRPTLGNRPSVGLASIHIHHWETASGGRREPVEDSGTSTVPFISSIPPILELPAPSPLESDGERGRWWEGPRGSAFGDRVRD